MKSFALITQRIAIIAIAVSVIGSSFLPIFAPRAKAGVPVVEIGPSAGFLAEIAGVTTAETTQSFFEWAQTFVISTLKRRLLDVLIDQTVGYIQGGGKPQFVTDWRGFLNDAGNQAAGDFAQSVGAGFLCSPFNLQIQLALLPVPSFSQRASCTLDDIIANIDAFYNDFRNGGWIAFNNAWQPQNHYFGSLLMASQEQEIKRNKAAAAARDEAISGQGFIGVKECDENGRNCVIKTPGRALGDSVAKAIGSDFDFILNAEQVGDYAAAIANALINRIITEGLDEAGLISSPSNTNQAINTSNTLTQNNFEKIRSDVLGLIDRTLVPRLDAHNIINSLIADLNSFENELNALLDNFNNLNRSVCLTLIGDPIVVNDVKDQISREIAQTQQTISQLQSDRTQNQSIIDTLSSAKTEIEALTSSDEDLVELTDTYNSISSVLNPSEATNFKSILEEQNIEEQDNITAKLSDFRQKLAICELQP